MKAAFGKIEITPSPDMLGAYRRSPDRKARGTHDPLLARWGIFEQEGERWCLLGLDVMSMLTHQAYRWRCAIAQAIGVSHESVTIACTHTHNSVDINDARGEYDLQWENDLLLELVRQIRETGTQLKSVECQWYRTEYAEAINRHNSDWGKTDDVKPIDPELSFIRVTESGNPDRCIGYLVHYAAHPTTAMNVDFLYSGDYPGLLLSELDQEWKGVGIFLMGAAGNVNLEVGERSYELTEKHASAIAEKVRNAAPCSYPDPKPFSIRAVEWIVAIRDDLPKPEEVRRLVEKRLAEVEASATESPDSIWNWVRTQRLAEYSSIIYPALNRVVAQRVSLGGRTLVFLPGEWFVQFGLSLKADRPQLHPLWIGYSNGHIGYLPRSEEYGQGYMVKKSSNFLKRGESERLYDKVLHWLE